ncbi:MAG: hypothetical protein ABIZ49_05920 [Opitutaceae bacterium]
MNYISFALPLIALVSFAANARADEPVVLRMLSGEVPADIQTVQADNRLGNVIVIAVAEGFGWEWRLRSSDGKTARAEHYVEECRLDVRRTGGTLQLIVVRPDTEPPRTTRSSRTGWRFLFWSGSRTESSSDGDVRSDLTLRVPAAVAVDVKNRFGGVRVTGTRGAVAVDCQNGRVDLSDLGDAVTVRTSFGSLHAERIGVAHLTTQNGTLDVREVAGDLQATASFAKLIVHDVKGNAVLKNQNGAIEAVRITGNLVAATSFAELRVTEIGGRAALKGQNSRVEATDITGAVEATTSFGPMQVRGLGAGAQLTNQNGAIEAFRVTGDLVATTSFATLQAEEIGGAADLSCRNGKIDAARITGNLRASTSFAPLRVRDIGGAAELKWQNSEIAASGMSGDVRAQTSFARMQLEGSGRHFVARNQNGAVEIVARSPEVRQIEASASFASIDVRLPNDTKPLIRATTSFGKVRSDFPVLHSDTVSDATFAADTAPLKVSLSGQNGDIRVQQLAAR